MERGLSMPQPLYREGDVVLIRVEVKHDFNDGDPYLHCIKPGRHYNSFAIEPDAVDSIVHKQFKAGEKIYSSEEERSGEVVATDGYRVWVKTAHSYFTARSTELTLVEEKSESPLPEAIDAII